MMASTVRSSAHTTASVTLVITPSLLFTSLIRANVVPPADLIVSTPDLSRLVTIEGSGLCDVVRFGGCDSLVLVFTVTNTSANALDLTFAGGAAMFISGDPKDFFVNSIGD